MRLTAWLIGLMVLIGIGVSDNGVAAQSDSVRITATQLTDHIYMFTSTSQFAINQVASVGPDGILLVDVGLAETAPKLKDALHQMGNGRVRVVVNTHSHEDHASGNHFFRDEAVIIAQRNTGDRLSNKYYAFPPINGPNAPTLLFDDSLSIWFNGEEVRLTHVPTAHSDGDVVVHFVGSNIVCAGDLFFPGIIPFVDVSLGGSVLDYIKDVKQLAESYRPDTRFIAGHGRIYSTDDLLNYYDSLQATSEKVRQGMIAGKSVEELQKQKILAAWTSWNGPWPTTTVDYWIASLYQALSPRSSQPRVSVAAPLTATIMSRGVAAAVEQYRTLRQAQPDAYNYDEAELNALGYQLMSRRLVPEAIEIFRLNAQTYPNSFNVFDSFGEALLERGDTTEAILNYRKSLELNPKNTNAVDVLRKLGAK